MDLTNNIGQLTLPVKDLVSYISKILQSKVKSDRMVVEEIFNKKQYDRNDWIKSGETWIDIGGNIGIFSLYCLTKGATPIAYEPMTRNFDILKLLPIECYKVAVGNSNRQDKLYLDRNNSWRHCLRKVKGRESIDINVVDINTLPKCDGMKIDAEGSEIEIIYAMKKFPPKLVFEYDGGHHPEVKDYNKLIEYLETKYVEVIYQKFNRERFDFFPNGFLVYCNILK